MGIETYLRLYLYIVIIAGQKFIHKRFTNAYKATIGTLYINESVYVRNKYIKEKKTNGQKENILLFIIIIRG